MKKNKLMGLAITVMILLFSFQLVNAQSKEIGSLIKKVKEELGVPKGRISIFSLANCEGPEGKYTSEGDSEEGRLHFKQVFSYKEEIVDLKIEGEKGTDKTNGEPLSEFMIFYGKMHDYVRIALQPEYFLNEVDSLQKDEDGSTLFGKTQFGYVAEYKISSDHIPEQFKFYLDDELFITTIFDSWSTTKNEIKVPKLVRIIDGEKIFTFDYEIIKITLSK